MVLTAIAWIYVVLMVAMVEAASSQGTVLGAVVTFVLWGVLPLSIVGYLFFSPARRRIRRAAAEPAASADAVGLDPDGGSHAPGHAVAPERKEP